MDVQSVAKEAYGWLEYVHENDPRRRRAGIVTTKDGHPQWVLDLIYEAHDSMLPDDRTYALVSNALEVIADGADDEDGEHEFADAAVDIYTHDRLAWLASNLNRPSLVDEARGEGLISADTDIVDAIGAGQYVEAQRVYSSVYRSLESYVRDHEDDDEQAEVTA